MRRSRPCVGVGGLVLVASVLLGPESRGESLTIRTIDRRSGEPVPARVSVQDSSGQWQWGLDAEGSPLQYDGLPRIASAGTVTVDVAPGTVQVLASRPYSAKPYRAAVTVPPGGEATIAVPVDLGVDLRALGWYGGDAHTHVVHGEKHHAMDLPTAARIARSEGLDWVALGEVWTSRPGPQPTPAERSDLCRELSDDRLLVAWTKEHPKDHLGHMAAFPLGVDRTFADAVGANEYAGSLEERETYAHLEIVRELQALGSLAVYTHPTREYGGTPESVGNIVRELPFDVVAAPWSIEALDVLTDAPGNDANVRLWKLLLSRGLRIPVCGFSDACYDRRGERPGDTRTYVYLGDRPPAMDAIIAGIRAGRTFATTGPLVAFTVDEQPPGKVFPADGVPRLARISAWNLVDYRDPRQPAVLIDAVVLRNGEPWRKLEPEGREIHEASWTVEIQESATAWYAVEVHGSSRSQYALTSPVYFEGEDYRAPRAATTVVEGRVRDRTGRPLAGRVLAVEYGKHTRRIIGEAPLADGAYRIECPASARLVAEVDGVASEPRSLLLHYDPLYRELFWPIRRAQLLDPEFYEEIERRLGAVRLDFELDLPTPTRLETILEHDDEEFLWFHPRAAAIPGRGRDGMPRVIVTIQKHLRVSDYYSGLHVLVTDDLGATWRGPTAVDALDWTREPSGVLPSPVTIAVCDVTPGWHAPTGRLLAVGARVRYSPEGRQLEDRPRSHRTAYAVHDPETDTWTTWRILKLPEEERFQFARNACSQWLVEPDGTILLPLYHGPSAREPFSVTVVRCRFDGETLEYVAAGGALRLADVRGLCEPSLAKHGGRYFLTLRNDLRGYVTSSDDGLRYETIRPWTFDDGSELGSYNTQQHWVVQDGKLLLVYTRRGAGNDHVMRHRAPLFLAEVDPGRLHVLRATERVIVPERGATLGNFGAARITDAESWVTVSEGVWSDDARKRGATGATFLVRIGGGRAAR